MYHNRFQPGPRGLRQPVRQQPDQRLSPLLPDRQARNHHLRRHARLLAADAVNRNAVRAQIEIGCREFERHFGKRPQGIWLPECGYAPGVDEMLARRRHPLFLRRYARRLVRRASAQVRRLCADPLPQERRGRLARDTESSKQVWSAIEGYPGDYQYREFYRDVGFDLDYEYLEAAPAPDRHRAATWASSTYKITGRGDHKEYYNPQAALDKAAEPRRQLHVQSRKAGRMARRLDGWPAAADRRAV